MTDAPEPRPTEPQAPPAQPAAAPPAVSNAPRSSRLPQVAAWIAIVAGVLVIMPVIFFAGFFLGRVSDGFGGHHHRMHWHDRMPSRYFDHPGPGPRFSPSAPGTRPAPPTEPAAPSPTATPRP